MSLQPIHILNIAIRFSINFPFVTGSPSFDKKKQALSLVSAVLQAYNQQSRISRTRGDFKRAYCILSCIFKLSQGGTWGESTRENTCPPRRFILWQRYTRAVASPYLGTIKMDLSDFPFVLHDTVRVLPLSFPFRALHHSVVSVALALWNMVSRNR